MARQSIKKGTAKRSCYLSLAKTGSGRVEISEYLGELRVLVHKNVN